MVEVSIALLLGARLLTKPLRLFVDDTDMFKRAGGGGYEYFGIDPRGAIVVVRPDGYVGMVAPFEQHKAIDEYFASFLVA